MSQKLQKKEEDYYREESYIIPIVEREEETYNLDEKDTEILPQGSIKYELNLIEFPIFSKDRSIKDNTSKKYVFSEKNDEYIEIIPSNDRNDLTKKILQEFDEQIYYGLMRIYEETKNRTIISNYSELLRVSGIEYKGENKERVKDSLERMKGCTIVFNSCYFSKSVEGTLRDTKKINLLSSLRTISITDKVAKEYKEHFEKHGNLKEIFIATLNEDIVKNLDNKLHKYFQIEDLRDIKNSTARKLFILLTKWKHWQKDNPLRRTTKLLASRIPLSWKKTNIPQTIRSLEKACEELKAIGKIKDYKINSENRLMESTIDFFFEKDSENTIDKINSKVGIEKTGHEHIIIDKIEEKYIEEAEIVEEKEIVYSQEVLDLFELLPKDEQIDIRKKEIDTLLKNHSFEYLKSDIAYCQKKKPKEFWGYFIKSTKEGHYSMAEIEKEKKKEEAKRKKEEKEKEEKLMQEQEDKEKRELLRYILKEEIDNIQEKWDKRSDSVKRIHNLTNTTFDIFLEVEVLENKELMEKLRYRKKVLG